MLLDRICFVLFLVSFGLWAYDQNVGAALGFFCASLWCLIAMMRENA